ncbi:MAG: ATP-binding protein [Anaerolineales bacterium]
MIDSRSLFVQMVVAFIAVVFLASVAIGVPSIWLLQSQLDHQARIQIDQGQRVTIALYDFQYNEILDLATITAQRPTLQELLAQKDADRLASYLTTLETGAGLDGVLICDPQGNLFAGTVGSLDATVCASWIDGIYHYDQNTDYIYLTANHPIEYAGNLLGDVFVLRRLDDTFVSQMSDQTGLEHLLWRDGRLAASSISEVEPGIDLAGEDLPVRRLDLNGVRYYSGYFPLDTAGLYTEVLLDVSELVATQTRLIRILILSILGVSLVGSLFGILIVRRINRPLLQLSAAAARFGTGDMQSPVQIETGLNEITQVAETLENARLDLLATLTSLEKERDWSEHLLASIVEGIITIDDEQRVTFFSHGAEGILGISAEDAIGCDVNEIFNFKENHKEFQSILPAALEHRQKIDVFLPDQQVASLAVTGARLARAGERNSETVLVFQDISQEEAVHRLLGQFLANIAHEFRTPLSALEASIELLLDQTPELSKTELLELHTSLHLGVLGLHTLVDNLLESANIEARRFRVSPKPCNLKEVIAEAVQTMQPLLNKYDQHLTINLPLENLVVRADPRRTVQVLINLLSNAIRYGPPNEEIVLGFRAVDDFALVEVLDKGPGIAPEDRLNLFRRFVFPQSADHVSPTGAGLGLSVVEAIVTAHGGKVGVEDNHGAGSNFWFTLPLDKDV